MSQKYMYTSTVQKGVTVIIHCDSGSTLSMDLLYFFPLTHIILFHLAQSLPSLFKHILVENISNRNKIYNSRTKRMVPLHVCRSEFSRSQPICTVLVIVSYKMCCLPTMMYLSL